MSPRTKLPAKGADGRPVAQNRRARHDYDILETYEAGIVLAGSEVKSLREGKAQLRDSFARVQDGEVWLYGVHVPPYAFASGFGATDPDRRRKLLLHRRQIDELAPAHHPGLVDAGARSPSTSRTDGPRSTWPWRGAASATTSGTPSPPGTPTWRPDVQAAASGVAWTHERHCSPRPHRRRPGGAQLEPPGDSGAHRRRPGEQPLFQSKHPAIRVRRTTSPAG